MTTETLSLERFATGAVRSSDADEYALELVSPVAARLVIRHALTLDHDEAASEIGRTELAPEALDSVYWFLQGGGHAEWLAEAALLLAAANAEVPDGTPAGVCAAHAILAAGKACREGERKYSAYNWERGMPVRSLLNHAIRHICLYQTGDRSEPHLEHAIWGLFAAIHSFELWPELNQGQLRGAGCVPPAAESPAAAGDSAA